MKKVTHLSLLLMTIISLFSNQQVQAQGLLSRGEYINQLSLSFGSDQKLEAGKQYMNDFESVLSELASSGSSLTDAHIIEIIYRLAEGYPGGIDHSTEMSLTVYAGNYMANYSSQDESTKVSETDSTPYQNWIGDYKSSDAVASITLENVTIPASEYNQRTEEHFVWYLSNKVSVSESFKPDPTHHLTIKSDGSVHHQGTEGFGYEDYHYQDTVGAMIRLGTNRYFFYNDINHSYDLVWFQQVESDSIDDIVFNVDLTRFDKVFDETESQSSTYQSAVQLHQAFEAYNWISSPEALEAYGDFSYVIENASFGNLGTDTKTGEVKAMVNREIYTLSDNIPVDHRNNQILSYPYYRPNGSGAFMQVSYPIYDLFAMGATLIFYEVTPDMFKPIDYDFYQYNSVNEFVNINPNIIAVSQYWGSPRDIYQLAIPTLNPSTGVQEVSFIIYDNSQIFHYQSIPYSTYKDMPAKANYQNYNHYYMKYKN